MGMKGAVGARGGQEVEEEDTEAALDVTKQVANASISAAPVLVGQGGEVTGVKGRVASLLKGAAETTGVPPEAR